MTSFASRILPFALAASVVTSAQAGAREDCISRLIPEWDKAATVVAEKNTLLGKTVAYKLSGEGEDKLALLYSHSATAHLYSVAALHLDGGAPKIDDAGMIGASPNSVKSLMSYDTWLNGGKQKWESCFSSPAHP